MVWDPSRGVVLLTGGSPSQGDGFFDDLWSWDGSSWKLLGNTGVQINSQRLAYDSKGNRMLMHGGFWSAGRGKESKFYSDLWELDGLKWKVLSQSPGAGMAEHGFAVDEARGRILAVGMEGAYSFDGTKWEPLEMPAAKPGFISAWDSARGVMVLHGGEVSGTRPSASGETWELHGSEWKKVASDGPPRVGGRLVYDSARKVTLLMGGQSQMHLRPAPTHTDLWAWDGSSWKLLSQTGPGPFDVESAAFDEKRGRLVVFGSLKSGVAELWEWDGAKWEKRG